MDRNTTLGIAGGITLALAAAATAIGVNLGIMSTSGATQGPGTFQPTAAVMSDVTAPADPGSVTLFVDENGNPIDPSTLSTATSTATSTPVSVPTPTESSLAPSPSTFSHASDDADDDAGQDGTVVGHDRDDERSTEDHDSTDHRSTDHEAGHDDDD